MITLKEIDLKEKEILDKLMQLYLHDISLYFPIEYDEKTILYKYNYINKYFNNEENKAFFIQNDKNIVGFILINITKEKNIVQEIFILNNHKRKGIGKIAVNKIFEKYKGIWEVKSLPNKKSAEEFWISTIKEYTKDNFKLEYVGKYNRAVITFNNKS